MFLPNLQKHSSAPISAANHYTVSLRVGRRQSNTSFTPRWQRQLYAKSLKIFATLRKPRRNSKIRIGRDWTKQSSAVENFTERMRILHPTSMVYQTQSERWLPAIVKAYIAVIGISNASRILPSRKTKHIALEHITLRKVEYFFPRRVPGHELPPAHRYDPPKRNFIRRLTSSSLPGERSITSITNQSWPWTTRRHTSGG